MTIITFLLDGKLDTVNKTVNTIYTEYLAGAMIWASYLSICTCNYYELNYQSFYLLTEGARVPFCSTLTSFLISAQGGLFLFAIHNITTASRFPKLQGANINK